MQNGPDGLKETRWTLFSTVYPASTTRLQYNLHSCRCPVCRGKFRMFRVKSWTDCTTVQWPLSKTLGTLPVIGWNQHLRSLTLEDVWPADFRPQKSSFRRRKSNFNRISRVKVIHFINSVESMPCQFDVFCQQVVDSRAVGFTVAVFIGLTIGFPEKSAVWKFNKV